MYPGYDDEALLTGTEAARAVFVRKQLIRRWVELGHLEPVDHTPNGAPLYRFGDVRKAEKRTRRSPYSSRNPSRLVDA